MLRMNLIFFLFLFSFFCRVRPKISHLRDAAPLLELDRDERKLEAFLQLHKHDLLVADLRIFLPFTINLDPYLRKVLKGLISFVQNITESSQSFVILIKNNIFQRINKHSKMKVLFFQ